MSVEGKAGRPDEDPRIRWYHEAGPTAPRLAYGATDGAVWQFDGEWSASSYNAMTILDCLLLRTLLDEAHRKISEHLRELKVSS